LDLSFDRLLMMMNRILRWGYAYHSATFVVSLDARNTEQGMTEWEDSWLVLWTYFVSVIKSRIKWTGRKAKACETRNAYLQGKRQIITPSVDGKILFNWQLLSLSLGSLCWV